MPSSSVTFRFLAEPTDVNFGGKVHGGVVMKWIDQAGYACAAGWSGHYCVTVSVAGVKFQRPILVGQIVEVKASIAHTGKTSMQIFIQVRCGDPKTQNLVETNHCVISFIAMDADHKVPANVAFQPSVELVVMSTFAPSATLLSVLTVLSFIARNVTMMAVLASVVKVA